MEAENDHKGRGVDMRCRSTSSWMSTGKWIIKILNRLEVGAANTKSN